MPTLLDGIAAVLLTYASQSLAACLIALAAAVIVRRPQHRDVLWKTALLAPPLATSATMALSSRGQSIGFVDLADVVRRLVHAPLPGRRIIVRVLDTPEGHTMSRQIIDPVTHALSSAAVVIALGCIALAAARAVHRRRALARALAPRHAVSSSTGISHARGVPLSIADALPSPIALASGGICLPRIVMTEFSCEHRDALIAHELAHLERRDPAWLLAVEIIVALTAFQPLIFVVVRAFRRDVELICDESAVRRTTDRHALIGALARLASPFDSRASLTGAATAYDGSPLVARAHRIASVPLDAPADDGRRRAMLAAIAACTLLFAVPVISASGRLSDLPIDPLDGARRLRAAGRVVTVDSSRLVLERRIILRAR